MFEIELLEFAAVKSSSQKQVLAIADHAANRETAHDDGIQTLHVRKINMQFN